MGQRIIFNYNYTVFCNECGAIISNNTEPTVHSGIFAEFPINGYTCSCGNVSNFNISKSEIKRLKIDVNVVDVQ